MSGVAALTRDQLDRVRAIATVLLPGSAESPAPIELADFDELVQTAAVAIGGPAGALAAAIGSTPVEPTWESLSAFSDEDPSAFEQVSLLVVGAYFMSPAVLGSLRIPSGERRPARPEQVVDELSTGILDAVYERGCPVRSLEEVNRKAHAG